ncbi:cell division protein FtsA [Entomobacter blattae]|uniref:Cell division protein FtsA n=1 Tax=Entomobacter blattae TaxID=2762277 RepID=A0A7H1NNS5_9PROT|nr:cell division protein FtsA [Entomobacter blattae]QNT77435.1 Cell division protein FtsA [Entomobacter blattae]
MNELALTPPPSKKSGHFQKQAVRSPKNKALAILGSRFSSEITPPDDPPTHPKWLPGTFGVLDIGSSKICCFIGKGEPNGNLRILGAGWHRSHGVKQGGITHLKDAEKAIRAAVGQAEEAAERRLEKVFINLSCGQPESRLFNLRWPVGGRAVTEADIRRIVNEGLIRSTTEGRDIIHALPLGFAVDDTIGVTDPRGHQCDQLSASLHIIDASSMALRNLASVLVQAELKIEALVSSPLTSGLSVLAPDERDLGAIVVDMGAGITTIGIFGEDQLLHTAQVRIGGHHITRDIASMLSTSIASAERLKTFYGSATTSPDDDLEILPVQTTGDYVEQLINVPRSKIISIIRPRIEETLELIRDRLDSAGVGKAANGRVVLTGGASLLNGIGPLAARILNRQVRLGRPKGIIGLPGDPSIAPNFSTAAGLLAWAAGAGRSLTDIDFTENGRPNSFMRKIVDFLREKV